jgi:hypothetical protein
MHVLGLRAASKENHWAGMPYVKLSAEKKTGGRIPMLFR